ncbi:hypothetical protein Taro_026252 [Colocasia esculenta]|uniref:Uncharacterized protein n=1 Tax=Colocasia esculenta TaxID=4460 RepID=A0A843VCD4_COLES|nr:hypothetical protein [Colocasia esculenta]
MAAKGGAPQSSSNPPSADPACAYCTVVDMGRRKVQCKYCNRNNFVGHRKQVEGLLRKRTISDVLGADPAPVSLAGFSSDRLSRDRDQPIQSVWGRPIRDRFPEGKGGLGAYPQWENPAKGTFAAPGELVETDIKEPEAMDEKMSGSYLAESRVGFG